ncbi:DddA-like double-stranded DNA deaminase toxin [Nonomuraea sp. NPDC004186]
MTERQVNHSGGPCTRKYSCAAAVSAMFPQGSTLTVWFRNAAGTMRKVTLHRRAAH